MGSFRAMTLVEFSGLFIATYLCLFCAPSNGFNVSCYYTSWSQYRVGSGRFGVDDINPLLCTHLYYAFAKINGTSIQPFEYTDNKMWIKFNDLKKQNPNLKTLLSVGGATLSAQFPNVASTKDNRDAFINSAISLLRSYGFDGLDIDWEFPGTADKNNFKLLIQEAFTAFETEGNRNNRPRLLLSVCVPAGIDRINQGFDVRGTNSYVDFFNLMTLDYHGTWESETNLATPLTDMGDTFSVTTTIDHYLSLGASTEKVQLGLAFYAGTWAINASETESRIGTPATGPGAKGKFTQTPGILSYYEVCIHIRDKRCVPQYEDTYGFVYYCASNGTWITFENIRSLQKKVDFIASRNLGGAMIWSLDFDDFTGQFCGLGRYPLMNLVLKAATTKPFLTETSSGTTVSSGNDISFKRHKRQSSGCLEPNGFFADKNCSFYIYCVDGISSIPAQCPENGIFNPQTGTCESLNTTSYKCPIQTTAATDTTTITTEPSTSTSTETSTSTSTTPSTTTPSTTTPDTTSTSTSTAPSTTASTTPSTTTAATTTPVVTTSSTVQTPAIPRTDCPEPNGFFPDRNCSFYIWCVNGKSSTPIQCPNSTIFNPNNRLCENVATTNYTCPNTTTTSVASTTTVPDTTTTTVVSTTTTTVPSTIQTTTAGEFQCTVKYGIFPDPNCSYYNICNKGINNRVRCPRQTIFNPNNRQCENMATTTYQCPT